VTRHHNGAMSTRRMGSESSESRDRLLDVTLRLMLDEGYAAVTSRRVAALAGVKPPLVHYYFRTMEDLFLDAFRRGAEANLDRQAAALASAQPLRALWALNRDPTGSALTMEFMALANHRKAIRDEISAYAERFRAQQVEALAALAGGTGPLPPAAVSLLMVCISQVVGMEQGLGVTEGHAETLALVDQYLDRVEPAPG